MTPRIAKKWLLSAAVLAGGGSVLLLIRSLGMRFSGLLLLSAALLCFLWGLICWTGRAGGRLARVFRGGLCGILAVLCTIEGYVVIVGHSDRSALPADAVIVLGAGVNGEEPSLSLRTRLDAAYAYLEKNPDIPAVLTGGMGYGEKISEAECMYRELCRRGIAPQRLLREEQAVNTAENFRFSKVLLESCGIDPASARVAVVTNDFHLARAQLIAQRQGYGAAFGVTARLPWLHLEVNYYLREAFAMVKTVLFDIEVKTHE